MTPQENFVFGKNITSAYTPKPYNNSKCELMCVEVSGTFTDGSFIVEGRTDINNETFTPVAVINMSTLELSKNGAISAPGIYEVPVEGLQQIRVRTESVSSGYANIIGRTATQTEIDVVARALALAGGGGGGGTSDYNQLENIPIINADLDADGFTPVEGEYYRHVGEGGGSATPFVNGEAYDQIYFDTSKTVEEMNALLPSLAGTTIANFTDFGFGMGVFDGESAGEAEITVAYYGSYYPVYMGKGVGDRDAGWQEEFINQLNDMFNAAKEQLGRGVIFADVNNVPFVSATPFDSSTYKTGTIYKYEDGQYKELPTDVDLSNYYTKSEVNEKLTWEPGSGEHSVQTKGTGCDARGDYSVAEGNGTLAESDLSHAEGWASRTIIDDTDSETHGHASHAEGSHTIAKGAASHAEGNTTESIGMYSHAEGSGSISGGRSSHAEGDGTITENVAEHAEGTFNKSHSTANGDDGDTLHSIGIGTSMTDRKNAFEVLQNGDAYLIGVGNYSGTDIENTDTLQDVINKALELPDYDELDNIPIVNADLDADEFTPIEGTYYRHIGTGGGATPFVVGQTYDKVYFDTSKTVEEMLEIITTEFDWDNAEETAGLKYFKLVGKANADFLTTHNTIILAYFQYYNVYLLSSNINDNLIWVSDDFGSFSQGWSSNNAEFDEPIEIEVADNKSFISATPFSASSYQTGTIYKYEDREFKPIPTDSASSYDDLDNIPIVNADINEITPVEGTYYRHIGEGPIPLEVGKTYTSIYFNGYTPTSKIESIIDASFETISEGYKYGRLISKGDSGGYDDLWCVLEEPGGVRGIACNGGATAIYESDTTWEGIDPKDIDAFCEWFNDQWLSSGFIPTYIAPGLENFMAATPFGPYKSGTIYKYEDGEFKELPTDVDLSNYYTKTEVDDKLDDKQDSLVSGTNIKTINNQSILGSGNIEIQSGEGGTVKSVNGADPDENGNVEINGYDIMFDVDSTESLSYKINNLDSEIDDKQDTLISGTTIKTINNQSILGSGNIEIQSGEGGTWGSIQGTLTNQQDLVQYISTQINNAVGNIEATLQAIRGTAQ